MFATTALNFDKLKTALSLLDYSAKKSFMGIREIYLPSLEEVLDNLEVKTLWKARTIMKYIGIEQARNFVFE